MNAVPLVRRTPWSWTCERVTSSLTCLSWRYDYVPSRLDELAHISILSDNVTYSYLIEQVGHVEQSAQPIRIDLMYGGTDTERCSDTYANGSPCAWHISCTLHAHSLESFLEAWTWKISYFIDGLLSAFPVALGSLRIACKLVTDGCLGYVLLCYYLEYDDFVGDNPNALPILKILTLVRYAVNRRTRLILPKRVPMHR